MLGEAEGWTQYDTEQTIIFRIMLTKNLITNLSNHLVVILNTF